MAALLFLSIPEAAKVLRVSPQTVRRRIRDGRLKAYQVRGSRGAMTYRVELPTNVLSERLEIPDDVAAALARGLTDLNAARADIALFTQERTAFQEEIRRLRAERAEVRAQLANFQGNETDEEAV